MAEPLPYEVLDLIQRCLPTMEHVELLLALAREEPRSFTPTELATETKSNVAGTHARLQELTRAGLLVCDDGPEGDRYRFAPARPLLRRGTEELRRMYTTRPVSLVRAIYERPPSAIRSFADAFRIRGEES